MNSNFGCLRTKLITHLDILNLFWGDLELSNTYKRKKTLWALIQWEVYLQFIERHVHNVILSCWLHFQGLNHWFPLAMHLFNENLLHLLVIKHQKQSLRRMMRNKKRIKTNSFPKYHPHWPSCSLKFPLFF